VVTGTTYIAKPQTTETSRCSSIYCTSLREKIRMRAKRTSCAPDVASNQGPQKSVSVCVGEIETATMRQRQTRHRRYFVLFATAIASIHIHRLRLVAFLSDKLARIEEEFSAPIVSLRLVAPSLSRLSSHFLTENLR
jgi:hypothetical protein